MTKYTHKLSNAWSKKVHKCFFFLTVNSIQKWMWVEKGVPGVSTCTVWQSEYPRFLICPFSHVVSLTTPTLCEVWKSAAIHSINPTLQLDSVLGPRGAINPHPPTPNTQCMALSGTLSWRINPWHLNYHHGKKKVLAFQTHLKLKARLNVFMYFNTWGREFCIT